MNRRFMLFLMAGTALGAALPAVSQTPSTGKVRQIGVLTPFGSVSAQADEAFAREMRRLGFVAGQNLVLHIREYAGRSDLLQTMAMELVRLNVDLILVNSVQAALVMKQVAGSIPIVFIGVNDPVRAGLVPSLARPGANITGTSTDVTPELYGKHVQLLKEVSPKLSRLAAIWNPANPAHGAFLEHAVGAAKGMGIAVQSVPVGESKDFEAGFAAITKERANGLHVFGGEINFLNRNRIVSFAAQNAIPAVYVFSAYTDAGGLISYSADLLDMIRRSAAQVAKVLNGEKPADIPVEQPTKFELVINVKTAKALGIVLAPSILIQATRLIE